MTGHPGRIVLALLALASLGAFAADDEDPIRAEVEKARKARTAALAKARQTLLDAFAAEIQAVTKADDLPLLEELTGELAVFSREGKLPNAKPMRGHVEKYEAAAGAADALLLEAYEAAVKEYTRAKQFDRAEAMRKESQALAEKRGSAAADRKKGSVEATIEKARGERQKALEAAKQEALLALEQALGAAAEKGDFDAVQAVRAAKDALEKGGKLPEDLPAFLKPIRSTHERAVTAADRQLVSGFNAAIKEARAGGDADRAREIAAEKDRFVEERGILLNRRIPKDAVFSRGRAYKLLTEKGDWLEAKARAEKLGGTLACIATAEENDFVTRLAAGLPGNKEVWIGLHDAGLASGKKTKKWAWVSGEPSSYTNWFPGQPDNSRREFFVALVNTGQWHDYHQAPKVKFPAICEWVNREPDFLKD
jgi:hypothetical protein